MLKITFTTVIFLC